MPGGQQGLRCLGVASNGGTANANREQPYALYEETIRTELTSERPIWILSAYGPGKGAPIQLFGGQPREQSFEELRLRQYQLAAQGKQQQAVQEAQELYNTAEQQIQKALSDIPAVIRYIVAGENQHPNRQDVCRGAPTAPRPGANTGPPFGQPSPLGRGPSAFGLPAAGATGTPAFGQPSLFGKLPAAASDPVSNHGQAANRFASPPPVTPAFGQPAFGQPNNPFARPAGATFGQPPQPASAFGTANQAVSAFGKGAPAPAATAPLNPFAQASAFQPPATNSFGPAVVDNPATANAPAFAPTGKPSPFAQPTATAFGQPLATGQPSGARKDASGRLISFNGKPVQYVDQEPCTRRPDGQWERVWFPDGRPTFTKPEDLPIEGYDRELEEQYRWMKTHGTFKGGVMPDLPPRREWVEWNF